MSEDGDFNFSNLSLTNAIEKLNDGSGDGGEINKKRYKLEDERINGIISLDVDSVSSFAKVAETKSVEIAKFDWVLSAVPHMVDDAKYLEACLQCNPNSASSLWSCKADVEIRLISNRNGAQDMVYHSHKFSQNFNYKNRKNDVLKFIGWDSLMCAELGYVRNDQLRIEAHLSIGNIVGLYNSRLFDFLSGSSVLSDVALQIEGHVLHVNKWYLAMYSRYFETLFFSGSFDENGKDEIELKEVALQEFIELLKIIYPSRAKVTAKTVGFLLKLGDKFDIPYITQACEDYLINTDDVTEEKKMVFSDHYYLSKLQEHCMSNFTNTGDITAFQKTPEYSELNDITRLAILEKIFKFI